MTLYDPQTDKRLAHRIDENLKRIFLAQFGHVLTSTEWRALPIATRRAIDRQARQQANHSAGSQ